MNWPDVYIPDAPKNISNNPMFDFEYYKKMTAVKPSPPLPPLGNIVISYADDESKRHAHALHRLLQIWQKNGEWRQLPVKQANTLVVLRNTMMPYKFHCLSPNEIRQQQTTLFVPTNKPHIIFMCCLNRDQEETNHPSFTAYMRLLAQQMGTDNVVWIFRAKRIQETITYANIPSGLKPNEQMDGNLNRFSLGFFQPPPTHFLLKPDNKFLLKPYARRYMLQSGLLLCTIVNLGYTGKYDRVPIIYRHRWFNDETMTDDRLEAVMTRYSIAKKQVSRREKQKEQNRKRSFLAQLATAVQDSAYDFTKSIMGLETQQEEDEEMERLRDQDDEFDEQPPIDQPSSVGPVNHTPTANTENSAGLDPTKSEDTRSHKRQRTM